MLENASGAGNGTFGLGDSWLGWIYPGLSMERNRLALCLVNGRESLGRELFLFR